MQPVVLQLVGMQPPLVLLLPVMQVAFEPQLVPTMHSMVQKPTLLCPEAVVHRFAIWPAQSFCVVQYLPTPSSLPACPGWQHEPLEPAMSGTTPHTPPVHMRDAHRSFKLSPPHGLPSAPQYSAWHTGGLSAALQRCPAAQSLALLAHTVCVTQPPVVVPPSPPAPLHQPSAFIAADWQSAHDPQANDVPSLVTYRHDALAPVVHSL